MSINIKECKRFFDQTLNDVKNVSMQCAEVIRQYNEIPWGPYLRFDLKDEAEGIIGRYIPLLNELRGNIPNTNNHFNQLVENFKSKQLNAMDFNFELINLTQGLMSYMEYLGHSGLPEISRALNIKQSSYVNSTPQNTPTQAVEVTQ